MTTSDCPRSLGGYTRGCRCEVCSYAMAEYLRAYRARRKNERELINGRWVAVKAPPGTHGREATYTNWWCRCDRCSSTMKKTRKARTPPPPAPNGTKRVRFGGRIVALVPAAQHGRYHTYRHHKCRCEKCCATYMEYQARWRSK